LVAHECLCADLIDELRGSDKSRPLSHEGEARKRQIIRRLLADDAKIRELTQPWLAKLDSILSARPTTSRVVATRR
jgi:flagellar protein FliT